MKLYTHYVLLLALHNSLLFAIDIPNEPEKIEFSSKDEAKGITDQKEQEINDRLNQEYEKAVEDHDLDKQLDVKKEILDAYNIILHAQNYILNNNPTDFELTDASNKKNAANQAITDTQKEIERLTKAIEEKFQPVDTSDSNPPKEKDNEPGETDEGPDESKSEAEEKEAEGEAEKCIKDSNKIILGDNDALKTAFDLYCAAAKDLFYYERTTFPENAQFSPTEWNKFRMKYYTADPTSDLYNTPYYQNIQKTESYKRVVEKLSGQSLQSVHETLDKKCVNALEKYTDLLKKLVNPTDQSNEQPQGGIDPFEGTL